MSIVLAGWFAVTMTLAQSCAAPAQNATPYSKTGSGASSYAAPVGGSLSGAADTSTTHLDTTGYSADQASSDALSSYLKHRRLPLVGAQVLKSPAGQRVVVLYGYVGSDYGKRDAATKTQSYLADSSVQLDNRIKVRPELLSAGSGGASGADSADQGAGGPGTSSADETAAAGSGNAGYPGVSSYEQQQNQVQQYAQQQNAGAAMSSVAPLLMLGLMALSMTSGGSFAVGPGSFGSSPFGSLGGSLFGTPAPYNPYPGFSSPPPYGGSGAPYGGSGSSYPPPYSSSPYGP